ncbi:MAG: hypothetical protein MI923_10420 [Phycisphaerales bacterium]|nr:hypothetical protein [Phycisphaerales bacterium]
MPGIKKNSFRAKLFPELRRFATDSDRLAAFTPALNGALNSGLSIFLIVATVVVSFAGIVILVTIATTPVFVLAAIIPYILMIPLCQAVIFWVLGHRIRRELRRKLNVYGIRICIKCAYDLRANESGVCPECGTQVEQLSGLYCTEKNQEDDNRGC